LEKCSEVAVAEGRVTETAALMDMWGRR
jgi:hypothetical protein